MPYALVEGLSDAAERLDTAEPQVTRRGIGTEQSGIAFVEERGRRFHGDLTEHADQMFQLQAVRRP
ncbi:hypothetical protein [Sphaerisporangium aureirubrum]|uniref:Uncharacterized protein n=1 Tax=Sphaerisporangium aureirubrum TaxID=1544736 RepID=A0ABW1NPT1_9ACTN